MRLPRLNTAFELALDRFRNADTSRASFETRAMVVPATLRLRKVRDPIAAVEEAVRVLDQTDVVGRPRLPREVRARYGAVDPDEGMADGLGGEMSPCCHRLAAEKLRMVDRLELPHEYECSHCRRVWVIESSFDLSAVL